MVDFRVRDNFNDHPKVIGLPLDTIGLWTKAGAWCSRYLTDGYIPTDVLRILGGKPRHIKQLADHNLITPLGDGWQFVDWNQYQASREKIQAQRAKWRDQWHRRDT